MIKKAILVVFLILFIAGAVFAQRGTARAETVQVRLASPLPRNSDWGRALDRLAADVERVTTGNVRMVVIHDGREGGETKMLNSLSANSIQAGLFTTAGMADVCPPLMTLSIPFYLKNDAEFDAVLAELKPVLERRVKDDYVIIAWAKGGWIYLFSKEQVLTPNDLRRQKLATTPEMADVNKVFISMGFQLADADMTVIGQRLASGAINAIYFIPPAIAPMQLHRYLGNMLNLPIAPIMGGIVMNKVTWEKISRENQQEILRVAGRLAQEFDEATPRVEAAAVSSMDRDGLKVNIPTEAQQQQWVSEINAVLPSLIGNVFDRDIYQRMNEILARTRSGR